MTKHAHVLTVHTTTQPPHNLKNNKQCYVLATLKYYRFCIATVLEELHAFTLYPCSAVYTYRGIQRLLLILRVSIMCNVLCKGVVTLNNASHYFHSYCYCLAFITKSAVQKYHNISHSMQYPILLYPRRRRFRGVTQFPVWGYGPYPIHNVFGMARTQYSITPLKQPAGIAGISGARYPQLYGDSSPEIPRVVYCHHNKVSYLKLPVLNSFSHSQIAVHPHHPCARSRFHSPVAPSPPPTPPSRPTSCVLCGITLYESPPLSIIYHI